MVVKRTLAHHQRKTSLDGVQGHRSLEHSLSSVVDWCISRISRLLFHVAKVIESSLVLRCYTCLREVVLQVFDAPQSHYALSLCCTSAERFLKLVARVHVRVVCSLTTRLFNIRYRGRGGSREFKGGHEGVSSGRAKSSTTVHTTCFYTTKPTFL